MIKFSSEEDRLRGIEVIKKHEFGHVEERGRYDIIGGEVKDWKATIDTQYHIAPSTKKKLDEAKVNYMVTYNCR